MTHHPTLASDPGPNRRDLLGLGIMLLLAGLALLITHDSSGEEFTTTLPNWANALATVLLVVPVIWRRRYPAAIGLWIGVGFVAYRLLEVPEGTISSLAVFLAIHAVGAYEPRAAWRTGVRVLALLSGFGVLTWSLFREIDAVSFDASVAVLLTVGINVGFYVAAWLLGDAARRTREDKAELARRADALAAEREKVAEQAVTAERVRIARELHDVVAHHVSVMGVQAAAARHVMAADADRARDALEHVEESGRQAVSELQRLVGVLRSDASDGVDAPQPSLDDLDRLLDSMRVTGMTVDLRTIGQSTPMPSSVELSAFRIIQEALTNAVRHAPGAEVTVVLTHLPEALQVEVVNGPGRGGGGVAPGGGRGIIGMRERAGMLGGTVETGRIRRGGYRVRALLPVVRPVASGEHGDAAAEDEVMAR